MKARVVLVGGGSPAKCLDEFVTNDGTVPAAANAPGKPGQVTTDANYIYVCVAANVWKRAALSAWS